MIADADERRRALEARVDRVRRAMTEQGLDLLVAYTDGQHSMGGPTDGVRWLSGYKAMAEAVLLVPRDEAPTLLVTPGWDVARARRRSWVDRVVGGPRLEDVLDGEVQRHHLDKARAAIQGTPRLDARRQAALTRAFGQAPVSFDRELANLCKRRDALELRNVRCATQLAEQGYVHMQSVARPGVREHQMVGALSAHLRGLGADDNFLLVAASRQHAAIRVPGDRVLDDGDVILGEVSPSVDGDFTQICRTAVLGCPTALQCERFDLLVESFNAGLRAGGAGVSVSDVVSAMNAPLVREGFGDYCRQPYMRARGHGLGMGSRAPGDISADNQTILEEGMLFVLHPNQFLPGAGYLMVGGPVVVKQSGLELLGSQVPTLDSIRA